MAKDTFNIGKKYTPVLKEKSYTDIWNGKEEIPVSPLKPMDCFLVCKEIKEKFNIAGFIIVDTPEYSKDREIDAVVLASGPGYRVRGGIYPFHFDGQRVLNECTRGTIVHFLERAADSIFNKDGETYYLIQEHKVLFAIDKD